VHNAEDAGEAGAAEEVARHGRREWGRGGVAQPDQDGQDGSSGPGARNRERPDAREDAGEGQRVGELSAEAVGQRTPARLAGHAREPHHTDHGGRRQSRHAVVDQVRSVLRELSTQA
jgi:hypothetical protein